MYRNSQHVTGEYLLITSDTFFCTLLHKVVTILFQLVHITIGIEDRLFNVECKSDLFIGYRFTARPCPCPTMGLYFFAWFSFGHGIDDNTF